jgi:integrase
VIGARWGEINLAKRLWAAPAERIKAGREHRVPLSDPAIALLEELEAIRSGDFIFPGGCASQPISNMAMMIVLRRMGCGGLTVHGFRSTFRCRADQFPARSRENGWLTQFLTRWRRPTGGAIYSRRADS